MGAKEKSARDRSRCVAEGGRQASDDREASVTEERE